MSTWLRNASFFGTLALGSGVAAMVLAVRATNCNPATSPVLLGGIGALVAFGAAAGYSGSRSGFNRNQAIAAGLGTGVLASLSLVVTLILFWTNSDLVDPCQPAADRVGAVPLVAGAMLAPLLVVLSGVAGWVGGVLGSRTES